MCVYDETVSEECRVCRCNNSRDEWELIILGLPGLFGLVLMKDTQHTIGHKQKAELNKKTDPDGEQIHQTNHFLYLSKESTDIGTEKRKNSGSATGDQTQGLWFCAPALWPLSYLRRSR